MAHKENKEAQAQVQYKGIELLSSSIAVPLGTENGIYAFTFDITTEIKLNPENKLIIVIIKVNIFTEDKSIILGEMSISNIFMVENYEDVILQDKKGIVNLPENLLITLSSVSLSTTRGVMWSTHKGTILHNAILPIIDTTSLFRKPQ